MVRYDTHGRKFVMPVPSNDQEHLHIQKPFPEGQGWDFAPKGPKPDTPTLGGRGGRGNRRVNFTPKQEEPWEDGASAAQLHVQSLEPSREKLMLRQFHGSLPEQQKLPDIRSRESSTGTVESRPHGIVSAVVNLTAIPPPKEDQFYGSGTETKRSICYNIAQDLVDVRSRQHIARRRAPKWACMHPEGTAYCMFCIPEADDIRYRESVVGRKEIRANARKVHAAMMTKKQKYKLQKKRQEQRAKVDEFLAEVDANPNPNPK